MKNLSKLIEKLDLEDGITQSQIPGIVFFKTSEHRPRMPLLYEPGICVLFQGKKIIYIKDRQFQYDPDNYLVVSMCTPCEGEALATPDQPVIGMYIYIDIVQIFELISLSGKNIDTKSFSEKGLRGIGPAPVNEKMADVIKRLICCHFNDSDARILGPGLIREILYRALEGKQAPILLALTNRDGNYSKIAHTLRFIQKNYMDNFEVEELAGKVNMGLSAFHRAFKKVTSDTPIQYIKKIRLIKANSLIMQDKLKAYEAAEKVGYESTSQFSREFKRFFGNNPSEI